MQTLNHVQFEGRNNSYPFNYRLASLCLEDYCEKIFSKIFKVRFYTPELKLLSIENFITNLIICYSVGKSLAVPLDSSVYSIPPIYGMYHFSYKSFIKIYDYLLSTGRIVITSRHHYEKYTGEGYRTRICVTDKFIDEVGISAFDFYKMKYKTSLLIKDKNKRLIHYDKDTETQKIEGDLIKINEVARSQKITLPIDKIEDLSQVFSAAKISHFFNTLIPSISSDTCYDITPSLIDILPVIDTDISGMLVSPLPITHIISYKSGKQFKFKRKGGFEEIVIDTYLYRVFNDGSIKYCGRFFGADYQNYPKDWRRFILINGNEIVELDYSNYHIQMLYNLCGIDFTGDAYLSVYDEPGCRPIIKQLTQIVINAKDDRQSKQAFNKLKSENEYLFNKYDLNYDWLYNRLYEVHYPISGYFNTGIAKTLMRYDSDIAGDVQIHFANQEISCLPVHDSFLVARKYENELKAVMRSTYKSKFKYDIEIK